MFVAYMFSEGIKKKHWPEMCLVNPLSATTQNGQTLKQFVGNSQRVGLAVKGLIFSMCIYGHFWQFEFLITWKEPCKFQNSKESKIILFNPCFFPPFFFFFFFLWSYLHWEIFSFLKIMWNIVGLTADIWIYVFILKILNPHPFPQ